MATVGFDWPDITGVLAKVEEELAEVKEAIQENKPENIEEGGWRPPVFYRQPLTLFEAGYGKRPPQDHL